MRATRSRSSDGGRTWHETRIGGPFDLRTAPFIPPGLNLPGYFLGEYQGLTAIPGGFLAVFPQASPQARQGMTDGFSARIHLSPRGSENDLQPNVRNDTKGGQA